MLYQTQGTSDNQTHQCLQVLPGGREAANLDLSDEFRLFIPPLSPGEKAALQASILEQGCRDPLVIWAQEGILIDGHNRYSICVAHSIPYQTVEMSFDNRNTVKLWMIGNQRLKQVCDRINRLFESGNLD